MMFRQNLEYDFSSKSRSGFYPDLSMIFYPNVEYDFHPNLEYDFSSKSRVWMIIQI